MSDVDVWVVWGEFYSEGRDIYGVFGDELEARRFADVEENVKYCTGPRITGMKFGGFGGE